MTFASFAHWVHNSRNADLAIVSQQFHGLALFRVIGCLLKFKEIPRDSFSMFQIITTATPSELLRRRIGWCCSSFGCTLALFHFALCASSWNLISDSSSRQCMHECSFFVNLVEEIQLLDLVRIIDFFSCILHPHLLEDISFAFQFNRTIPSIEFELVFAMGSRELSRIEERFGKTRITSTLMILSLWAFHVPAWCCTCWCRVKVHHDIFVTQLLFLFHHLDCGC